MNSSITDTLTDLAPCADDLLPEPTPEHKRALMLRPPTLRCAVCRKALGPGERVVSDPRRARWVCLSCA